MLDLAVDLAQRQASDQPLTRPKQTVFELRAGLCWTVTGVVAAISVTFMSAGCRQTSSQASPAPVDRACAADAIGTLRFLPTISACAADDWVCRGKCFTGDAASCLAMAYAAEKNPDTAEEAVRLYHRGCLLGAANACTNYAAGIWAGKHSDDQLACARRTFEKACAAKEPFACGMVGRLMLESTAPAPNPEARRYLEAACDEVGGFPCRVLARHLESGKPAVRPEVIRALLTRACAGGDPDACGEPATAEETFN